MRHLAALLALLAAAPAHADDRTVVFFVPELRGAVTLGVEARSAIERAVLSGVSTTPTTAVVGHLGYRLYLDGHGRRSVGAYLAAGATASEAGRTAVTHLDAGVSLQLRAVSPEFFYWMLGAFAEAGPVFPREAPPERVSDAAGLRWAAGVETGPGVLWFLDPWLFGDVSGRVGVQSITVAGGDSVMLFAGMRLTFDLTHR